MVIRRFLLLLFMLVCCFAANAQFDAQFSQYWAVTGYYNPAYAGQNDKLIVSGAYSQQLSGFTNAPKSMYFAADMPFKFLGVKHGVGLALFNETIGLFKNQSIGLQYSYKKSIEKGQLSIGGQIGALNVGFDPSKIQLPESGGKDNAFPTSNVSGMSMDAALGAFYTNPTFYAGISATHITSPTILMGKSNEFKVNPAFYLTGGYNIKTKSPLIWLQPSFLVKSDLVATKIDLTGRAFYSYNEKTFYGGLSYSPGTSVAFLIGAKMKNISVGYAYDMFTSSIGVGSGSHDLFVTYSTDINFSNHSKNRHKSIRIL